jgi:flagellar biosynthesis anti-sigma factor FlgM
MSTSRIGSNTPKAPEGLNPAGAAPAQAEAGKVRDATKVNPAPQVTGDPLAAANAKSGKDYGVSISDSAKSRADGYRKALNIARDTPDIREDKVAALKKQIDEGSYQPDPGKIADGMLREAIKDHLADNER